MVVAVVTNREIDRHHTRSEAMDIAMVIERTMAV